MSGYANETPVKRSEPHWYLTHFEECPVCGRSETHRTRMAGPAPEDPSERYVFEERYDWCDYS